MTKASRWAWLVSSLCACGGVASTDDLGEPVVSVVARLEAAPPDMPAGALRATLVWLNTPPFGGVVCDDDDCRESTRHYTVLHTSDVEVQMEFPLTVRLGIFELPAPIAGEYPGTIASEGVSRLRLEYNSLPEAEVVLYEDGNDNQRLDLIEPGQPGPGPDRVVALSSGYDAQGNAIRTAIVNKRSPIPAGFTGTGGSILEVFALPLHPELVARGWAEGPESAFQPLRQTVPYADGVYALQLRVPASLAASQRAVLELHTLEPRDSLGWDFDLLARAEVSVSPVEGTVVQLYPVREGQASWLGRACNPFAKPAPAPLQPPLGSEIQCGAGSLRYATNPGDYCGVSRALSAGSFVWDDTSNPPWWPCDAGQVKPDSPYRTAVSTIGTTLRESGEIIGSWDKPFEQACGEGRIQHADASPGMRLPSVQPPAGSQVLCYGSDAFSFIPPRADGCRFKYTYELASDPAEPYQRAIDSWDLRATPPAWWPCDAAGGLRPNTPFVAGSTQMARSCAAPITEVWAGAAPRHARVRCDSATDLSYQPLWSDGCAPVHFTLIDPKQGGLSEAGELWPCDEDGNFISGKGYLPW